LESQVKIFISYSRKDSQITSDLANRLRRLGYKVRTDTTGIPGGATWLSEIEEAIARIGYFPHLSME
jgi:hypothetical protein